MLEAYVFPIDEILGEIVDADSDLAVLTDPHIIKALSSFKRIYKGDEISGAKGTKYWKERIEFYKYKVDLIENIYIGKLNEQRNAFTFVLSIFTIISWPLGMVCTYYGMQFKNMYELKADGWIQDDEANDPVILFAQPEWLFKMFRGVDFFWLVVCVIYFFMFLAMLHFKIFYTAS